MQGVEAQEELHILILSAPLFLTDCGLPSHHRWAPHIRH